MAPAEDGPEAYKIREKLAAPVTLEFVETPLGDVIDFLKDYTGVNIVLDKPSLKHQRIDGDTPVSVHVHSIALHAALGILLGQHNLTTMIDNECLIITSKLEQNNLQTLRVYAVAKMLAEPVKITGDEWVRIVTGLAEFEWQTSGYAEMRRWTVRTEVGSSLRVRRASQVVRAVIVEVQEKRFKVHYDKSADLADEWVSGEQFQQVPISLSVTDQLLIEYYEPAGSLVVLAPDSLQKPVQNLLGLMLKAAGAESPEQRVAR